MKRGAWGLLVPLMRLVYVLSEVTGGAEDRLVSIFNVNRFVGLWIASGAGRTMFNFKDPEAAQFNAAPLLHCLHHRGHKPLHDGFGLYFRQSSPLCNTVYYIGLSHGTCRGEPGICRTDIGNG